MKEIKEIKYLSTQQVADLLGISRVAVLKRIESGTLKAQKVGRNYVINYDDLTGRLTEEDKKEIKKIVKKAVQEYGETFNLLGKE